MITQCTAQVRESYNKSIIIFQMFSFLFHRRCKISTSSDMLFLQWQKLSMCAHLYLISSAVHMREKLFLSSHMHSCIVHIHHMHAIHDSPIFARDDK
ncbi:hypothetical protein GDO81_000864 [Engystomops pustulosus]|uniref:Uncharacterized protein n=1 Tax=Engystomops pustulosus TaxID=76066 RepID=A0AAV7D8K9_ENGPU|nr:hypothetical protein GDO81_000864 [Engystomops pustulosus]